MRLARFRSDEGICIGVLSRDGAKVHEVAAPEVGGSMSRFLALDSTARQSSTRAALEGAGRSTAEVALLAPVGDPGKILCIGQNYRDHCEEQGQPLPERAILFAKYSTALNDPNGVVRLPRASEQVDYEAELAVVIGGPAGGAREIAESDAMSYVAGYLCANDVSARDLQFGDKQWTRGKSPDGFFPIGPTLVTADEIADPHVLDISLTLNGQTMQKSNTSNLIFRIPFLISFLSQTMTLLPGDIISTGTPGGVGVFRKPPVLLKPGDTMTVTIEGVGSLTNTVA